MKPWELVLIIYNHSNIEKNYLALEVFSAQILEAKYVKAINYFQQRFHNFNKKKFGIFSNNLIFGAFRKKISEIIYFDFFDNNIPMEM